MLFASLKPSSLHLPLPFHHLLPRSRLQFLPHPRQQVHPNLPQYVILLTCCYEASDDLAFDKQEHLLCSDEIDGTINRLNADGSVTVLLVDSAGPEGLVVKQDGMILFAGQDTNRLARFAWDTQ